MITDIDCYRHCPWKVASARHNNHTDVKWLSRCPKLPATQLYVQQLIQVAIKSKQQRSASLAFVRGIHRWPMDSPKKVPVKRYALPCDVVLMIDIVPGWAFKHPYELLNLRAHKFPRVYKSSICSICQCIGKIFCVEFQSHPFNSTQISRHTWEDMHFILRWKLQSSQFVRVFETVPHLPNYTCVTRPQIDRLLSRNEDINICKVNLIMK